MYLRDSRVQAIAVFTNPAANGPAEKHRMKSVSDPPSAQAAVVEAIVVAWPARLA